MTYDIRLYDLAESILLEVVPPAQRHHLYVLAHQLALKIQVVIDDHVANIESSLGSKSDALR